MGNKLPSSRELAKNLKVSRIVTLAAYEQLLSEGYLIAKSGSGTYVSNNISNQANKPIKNYTGPKWFEPVPAIDTTIDKNATYDFTIGRPAKTLLSETNYKRSYRKALTRPFVSERTNSSGVSILKEEIADYLFRSRNIKCHPDQIIITTGVAETLRLISKATEQFSPITYYEDPGFQIGVHWLSQGKHTLKPLAIDENGIKTKGLPQKTDQPSMLFCTPSHQFPLGFRLSLKRRNDILRWASENDALILEDDYDSEFHYDAMPLPTLKSQDKTGQVLYFSSFSKSISPNVKIGYLIAPKNICHAINHIIHQEHAEPPTLPQYALAYFIRDGSLDKHIAKSRRHYAKLNKIMRDKLAILPDGVNVSGLDAGIHAFLSFNQRPTELLNRLKCNSIYVPVLENSNNWHGFSMGYGHFEEQHLKNALDIIICEIKSLYPEL